MEREEVDSSLKTLRRRKRGKETEREIQSHPEEGMCVYVCVYVCVCVCVCLAKAIFINSKKQTNSEDVVT